MRGWVAAASLVLACAAASGQDKPPVEVDPTIAVRKAYEAVTKAEKERDASQHPTTAEASKKFEAIWDKFATAFAKVDWTAWDAAKDADLLADGLYTVGSRAFDKCDYASTGKAWEFLVDHLPEHKTAKSVMATDLPQYYAAAGLFDKGAERLRASVDRLGPVDGARALFGLGDLLAAAGDLDGAKKAYADALAAYAKRPSGDKSADATIDFAKEYRAFVGRTAPEIRAADCVGGKPAALSSFAGRTVVLLVFKATTSWDDGAMKALDALHKKLSAKGLTVIGATSFECLSPMTMLPDPVDVDMPSGPDDIDGKPVKVTRATFHKHLETYRQRMKISFPLLVADGASFTNYAEKNLLSSNLVFVIDPGQKIVHAETSREWRATLGIAESVCARNAAAAGGTAPK